MSYLHYKDAKMAKKESELGYFPKKSGENSNEVIDSSWSVKGLLSFTDPTSVLVR